MKQIKICSKCKAQGAQPEGYKPSVTKTEKEKCDICGKKGWCIAWAKDGHPTEG